MAKAVDLTGQKFGKLTVVERHGTNNSGKPTWLCKCECGNNAIVSSGGLKTGNNKSCGCIRKKSESKANYSDLTGQRFDRLIVLKRAGSTNAHKALWKCQCDCGNIVFVTTGSLRNGHTKSCGCLGAEERIKANITHGGKGERLYNIWNGIKSRCYNKNSNGYENYGGRGIRMCDEWKNDYSKFRDWAHKNDYSSNLTIDRVNVNGNYEPSNCRWVTKQDQVENTRANVYLTLNGEKKTLTEWARIYNIPQKTVNYRFHRGWDEKDLFIPANSKPRESKIYITHNGETHTINEWANITGINKITIRTRLRNGVLPEHLFAPIRQGRKFDKRKEKRNL